MRVPNRGRATWYRRPDHCESGCPPSTLLAALAAGARREGRLQRSDMLMLRASSQAVRCSRPMASRGSHTRSSAGQRATARRDSKNRSPPSMSRRGTSVNPHSSTLRSAITFTKRSAGSSHRPCSRCAHPTPGSVAAPRRGSGVTNRCRRLGRPRSDPAAHARARSLVPTGQRDVSHG